MLPLSPITYVLVATNLLLPFASGSNIVILPVFTRANQVFYESMETELRIAGHEVTLLVFRENLGSILPPPNAILIKNDSKGVTEGSDVQLRKWELTALSTWDNAVAAVPASYADALEGQCGKILGNADILEHIRTEVRADIILADLRFGVCGLALGRMLGASVVGVLASPFPHKTEASYAPSYIPVMMDRSAWANPSIWEKLVSYYEHRKRAYFQDNDIPSAVCRHAPKCWSATDLYGDLSLVLVNGFPSWDAPARPVYPSLVFVGGLNFHTTTLLPKGLDDIARRHREGIILVTLVTSLPNSKYPGYILKSLIEGLSRLPHAIFWKTNFTEENLPKNIFLDPQFPTQNILGHVRTRLMISFCDRDTAFVAIYHRMPLLCLPLLEDQVDLARRVEAQGVGITLNLHQLSPDSLVDAIQTITSNKSFKQNAVYQSKLLRDLPETASDRLVFWIEYIIRHREFQTLRNPALQYDFSTLEVAAIVVGLIIGATLLVKYFKFITKTKKVVKGKDPIKRKAE